MRVYLEAGGDILLSWMKPFFEALPIEMPYLLGLRLGKL
jgi:hypothetical protein